MSKYEDGKVYLQTPSGGVIAVPLGKLSQEDQRWVRRQLSRQRSKEKEDSREKPAAVAGNDTWPGWRGPRRDGKSSDQGLLKQWPPEGPPLLWKAEGIGSGFSSVAVAGETVYITGDVQGRLVLFALGLDGTLRWKSDIDAAWSQSHPGARSTAMIDGSNLYLVSGNGLVGCYDTRSGRPKWNQSLRDFGGQVPQWGYAESVLIYHNLAIITPGGERCIVALDKSSGKPVWASQGFRAGAQYSSSIACIYAGAEMVVNGTDQGIVCVDPRGGQLLWANPFSARNTANCPTPVFSDGHVFWANGYGKGGICLRLAVERGRVTAQQAWTTRDMDCQHGGYIVHEGYLYGNHKDGWVCLELKTGRKMWDERAVGKGSVCFADGMLYLFAENGGKAGLATCSPEGLQMKGTFSVAGQGNSWAHPVVVGGRLYLRYDTHLYCFNVRAE